MANLVAKAVTAGAAVVAAIVARKTTDGTWKFVTGSDSPQNPDDPEIDLKEAIAFAVLSGALVGLARMLANRQTTRMMAKGAGKTPEQTADRANS
ncbi:DUF4235 domain-containing protein [Ornithinimicrobium avium]|uniref:DUF4235 domain-containing protein n=1 Tax=Ornithinimicrobium avium TaxID=2283195 RepID=A0A345NMV9_9MICO|nr:DUF4235 domain-containing protein [Ornithinimicrobium avium]AXH96367.1 DUF4235 domain-containing protein [Ornithinimicrobium avium]